MRILIMLLGVIFFPVVIAGMLLVGLFQGFGGEN
jgi:hypothetical protein